MYYSVTWSRYAILTYNMLCYSFKWLRYAILTYAIMVLQCRNIYAIITDNRPTVVQGQDTREHDNV